MDILNIFSGVEIGRFCEHVIFAIAVNQAIAQNNFFFDPKAKICEEAIRVNRRLKMDKMTEVLNICKGSAVTMVSKFGLSEALQQTCAQFLSQK